MPEFIANIAEGIFGKGGCMARIVAPILLVGGGAACLISYLSSQAGKGGSPQTVTGSTPMPSSTPIPTFTAVPQQPTIPPGFDPGNISCPPLDKMGVDYSAGATTLQGAINHILNTYPNSPSQDWYAYRLAEIRNAGAGQTADLHTVLQDPGNWNTVCHSGQLASVNNVDYTTGSTHGGAYSLQYGLGHASMQSLDGIVTGAMSIAGTAMFMLTVAGVAVNSAKATKMTADIYGWKAVPGKAIEALVMPYVEAGRWIGQKVSAGAHRALDAAHDIYQSLKVSPEPAQTLTPAPQPMQVALAYAG